MTPQKSHTFFGASFHTPSRACALRQAVAVVLVASASLAPLAACAQKPDDLTVDNAAAGAAAGIGGNAPAESAATEHVTVQRR